MATSGTKPILQTQHTGLSTGSDLCEKGDDLELPEMGPTSRAGTSNGRLQTVKEKKPEMGLKVLPRRAETGVGGSC